MKRRQKAKSWNAFPHLFDKNIGQVLDLLLCSNMWTVDDVGMLFFSKDMGPQNVLSILHFSMVVKHISLVTSLMHFIYNELLKIFRFYIVSFVYFHTISFIIFALWIIYIKGFLLKLNIDFFNLMNNFISEFSSSFQDKIYEY